MSENYNKLEKAIIDHLIEQYPGTALSDQLSSAQFKSREWTKVGFYVDFEVDRDLVKINFENCGGNYPVDGPTLISEGIEHGGGCLIWGKDGYLDCIELFAYSSYFNENIGDFSFE
jgi:hypothetical protein